MFEPLDPLLHQQIRLSIVSLLMGVKSAEFSFLLEHIDTTKGNISFQLTKLNEAGYVTIKKSMKGNYPLTSCSITDKGREAFQTYIEALQSYLK
ncbi:MAG: winged helix-turn-helix domain-containing protein [Prolixibacteraceae bacterium]